MLAIIPKGTSNKHNVEIPLTKDNIIPSANRLSVPRNPKTNPGTIYPAIPTKANIIVILLNGFGFVVGSIFIIELFYYYSAHL